MAQNIKITFENGRQCWVSSFNATIAKSLVNRFQSKIVSAPSISAPARQAASSKRVYKTGQAWQQEHNRHNKDEDYEVPRSKRKKPVHNKFGTGGATKTGKELLKDEIWTVESGEVKKGDKLITTYDFDRGSDSFWISNPDGAGSKSFEEKWDIVDYFLKRNPELFKTGGKTGSEIEYETVAAKGSANLHKKNTHFAIHNATNSIVFAWDFKGEDKEQMKLEPDHYFFKDIKDVVDGGVDKFRKSDYKIVERKNLEKQGIDLNDYLVFRGQKYGVGGVILPLVALYAGYKIGRFRPQKQSFETEGKIISKTAAAAKKAAQMAKKAAQMAKTAADNRRIKKATMKTGGRTASTKKKLSVWNWTDNISATASEFNTKAAATKFIKEFRARYEKQGYYKDNKWNKIAPADIELEIYEVE